MKRRSFFIYLACVFVAAVAAIEIGFRLFISDSNHPPRWLAISAGFPDLDQFLLDRDGARRAGQKYYDYHIFAPAPFRSRTLTITEYFSARRTPASLERDAARTIVWMFGGSTMQNFETSDEFTIANTVARAFATAGLAPRVENFGVGAFHSTLELVKFGRLLSEVPAAHRPRLAIFYDGYNDAGGSFGSGAGVLQTDLALKLAATVEARSAKIAVYAASQWIAQHLQSFGPVHRELGRALFRVRRAQPVTPVERAVATYVTNVELVSAMCRDQKIACYFVLQPLLVTKTPLTAVENAALREIQPALTDYTRQFYRMAIERLGRRADFIDASRCLDGRDKPDFYDFGHTSAFTAPVIGDFIASAVLARYRPD